MNQEKDPYKCRRRAPIITPQLPLTLTSLKESPRSASPSAARAQAMELPATSISFLQASFMSTCSCRLEAKAVLVATKAQLGAFVHSNFHVARSKWRGAKTRLAPWAVSVIDLPSPGKLAEVLTITRMPTTAAPDMAGLHHNMLALKMSQV